MLWGVASFSSLLVKKVERTCPRVLLFGFGPGAGCEDIFLAARCHTLLSRRPTRQSQVLHVYKVVLAYVSSLLGFPYETVSGGGGVTASDLVCESSKRVSRFFNGINKLFFLQLCQILPPASSSSHRLDFYWWFVGEGCRDWHP